jgi:hypothetical protein
LQLLSRPQCGLCEEFLADWSALARVVGLPDLQVLNVDEFPEHQRRHGLDVPVLLLDGVKICAHRLDRDELLRLLRPR